MVHDADRNRIRYEGLMKYCSDPVLILDPQQKVIDANEQALTLFDASIRNSRLHDIFEGIDILIEPAMNTNIIQSARVSFSPKAKKEISLILSFIPLTVAGKLSEILVVCRDLLEVERFRNENEDLKKKLVELEQLQDFARRVAGGKDAVPSAAAALKDLEVVKQRLEDATLKFENELGLAAVLQQSLLPEKTPENKNFNISCFFKPMEQVGGDYYDFVDLENNKKGIIVADVSGHGVSSAFITAMLKISFLNYAGRIRSPAKILEKLNRDYCSVIQTGDFVTAFYAVLDPNQSKITYCGAGHPRPLLFRKKGRDIEYLKSEGFFLGMFEDARYRDSVVGFYPGDRVLIYTDGIVEAFSDGKNEQFGEKRLLQSFKQNARVPVEPMIHKLVESVQQFMQKSRFYDDIALVAVEFKDSYTR